MIFPEKRSLTVVIVIFFVLVLLIVSQRGSDAEEIPSVLCVMIVSGSGGYPSYELGKAASFHSYMEDRYPSNQMVYLTRGSVTGSDGPADLENVEDAFEWLSQASSSEDEVVIYIYDHAQCINNEVRLSLNDGNLSVQTLDSWLDQVECWNMTLIVNGERSGLAGPDLSGPSRDIICSMGSEQQFDPDQFNITRSLEDPSADMNSDEIVDYIEAYWKEVENLEGSGQEPLSYEY